MRPSPSIALTLSLLAATSSFADIVVTQAGSFPASPDLTVIDDTQDTGSVTLNNDRRLTQTFQLSSGLTLDKFYIDVISLEASTSFTVSLFAVADTTVGAPNAVPSGSNLLTTTVASTPASLSGTSGVLEFDLTGPDEISLAASTGTEGYAIQLNRIAGDGAFIWRIHESGDGTSGGTIGPDLYVDGQAYGTPLGGGFTHGNSDYTLALQGVIPEPSTLALLGLGVLGVLASRRIK